MSNLTQAVIWLTEYNVIGWRYDSGTYARIHVTHILDKFAYAVVFTH